jgi:hypothetical protein
MTIARHLPRSMSSILEELELDQPDVVTIPMLAEMAGRDGLPARSEAEVKKLGYRLQELGWLGRLRTRGTWEFVPGARAGGDGSGDRHIEMRAQLALDPEWPGVLAMESAASVLGLAQRLPDREVVALPQGLARPKALSQWRVLRVPIPAVGVDLRQGLSSWSTEGLIAGIATRPSGYRDLVGLGQWLPEVGERLRGDLLLDCLAPAPPTVWQRAAYLTRLAGARHLSDDLLGIRPPRSPLWFSGSRTGGIFDPDTRVVDADLLPYLRHVGSA